MAVVSKDVIEESFGASIMLRVGLAMVGLPKFILLREARLDVPRWDGFVDHRLSAPLVAGMLAHDFSHQLLHQRLEGPIRWRIETGVCEIGSLQAPIQRTNVIPLWRRHLGIADLELEEGVVVPRLLLADLGQVRIQPIQLAISIQFRPIIIPGLGSVLGFADVVCLSQ